LNKPVTFSTFGYKRMTGKSSFMGFIQRILWNSGILNGTDKKNEGDFGESLVATLTRNSFSSKLKLQPSPSNFRFNSSFELVRILGCHKKKQEVNFDLLCLWVPRTDKSCNLLTRYFIKNFKFSIYIYFR